MGQLFHFSWPLCSKPSPQQCKLHLYSKFLQKDLSPPFFSRLKCPSLISKAGVAVQCFGLQ